MIKLLDFILCGTMVLAQIITIFLIAILVQAIFYRVFNINLYKIIKNKIIMLERRIQECLEVTDQC